MAEIRYFLGGNTPAGFYSLYDELSDLRKVRRLYILKGGAGCGKSTLMKRIALRGEEAGFKAERILCSADPGSLDGVIFPSLSAAVVDGTAPHVVEANYAGAAERYVDLSGFYDRAALEPLADAIVAATAEYKGQYKAVYRCLNAAGQLSRDRAEQVAADDVRQKLALRAKGIIRREIKPSKGGSGTLYRRFLTAVTCEGPVSLWDTVDGQAERVYRLSDSYGLSHWLLSPILNAALAAGQDCVACFDPMAPEQIAHLLLPELSLAFVTDCPMFPREGKDHRHLRLDAMTEAGLIRTLRPRLRFSQKVSAALVEEAVGGLARAKAAHDRLEALYNPHVNFDAVNRLADRLVEEILGRPVQAPL